MVTELYDSPAFCKRRTSTYCSDGTERWTAMLCPLSWASVLMGEFCGTTMDRATRSPVQPLAHRDDLDRVTRRLAKIVGVSAMEPRSTEPPDSAAMMGGPPMKLLQLIL